jgi:hypothetical protein
MTTSPPPLNLSFNFISRYHLKPPPEHIMFFQLYWQMPRYRAPLQFEHTINNLLYAISSRLHNLFQGTVLEYWLLDPSGRSYTFSLSVIVVAMIWVSVLSVSIRRRERDVLKEKSGKLGKEGEEGGEGGEREEEEGTHETQQMHTAVDITSSSSVEIPGPAGLAPRGHASSLFTPSKHHTSPTPHTPSPRPVKNFSGLAAEAPVTYATLLKTGMLHDDGSPTNKYRLLRLLEGDGVKDRVERERRD